MKQPLDAAGDWLRIWSDSQKSLFEAWGGGMAGLEKLTEGPAYATLLNLDKKMLNVQKLSVERSRDAERYWGLVQGAWNRAAERFSKALAQPGAEPIRNGREMMDLWLATVNKALLELHRSDEFIEAQRRMTRTASDYRLAEREIAESFCEAHHIPPRTEMDEMQRTVTELRRELRALKRERGEAPAKAAAKPRASSKKKRNP